ncbi:MULTISPECIES: hypothetical protein [unclassified Chelatococcus]|uniref:hypothetical protein n=1 Tax=unclassified Chelatococcus TaxID=2638111 RepID=UPI001BCB3547|nr:MULTISPECIES: hypothetical protein [unclassified Chelatococcus]CAH1665583.1 hypothetical protein CHELA41_22688 [Hyphomicrobiales bacterium]MBS7737740.1 hypothetical protein [Chelatococcus sp. HY11]MBX3547229.1 hypothetical protein [Chelatococcus sp.]MCO5077132.1 hypothetical protein [Chelatococcus sp.]CAH1681244.1 hypothetical protein CHELA20_52232 [Hyphomicrobiales bacterium]
MSEAEYEIDDVVRANIEGRVIEVRRNGQGEQVVVEYYDNEGDLRRRALWTTEIEPVVDDESAAPAVAMAAPIPRIAEVIPLRRAA